VARNDLYGVAVQIRNQELSSLHQRVNFFLIGTSFLVIAFVNVISREPHLLIMHKVALLVGIAGLVLSVFFTFVNFQNVRIIERLDEYIRSLESQGYLPPTPPFYYIRWTLVPAVPLRSWGREFRHWVRHRGAEYPAPYTVLIPLGSIVFWVLAIAIVLPLKHCLF